MTRFPEIERPRTTWILAVAIALLGTGIRLTHGDQVFTPAGVRFIGDTDPHYHVLRAERLLRGDANGLWFDSRMGFPAGGRILWPPGWDWLIAGSSLLVTPGDPARADIERVAALLPVVVSAAGLLAIAAVGVAWLGSAAGLLGALLAAILPLHVEFGVVGRPDQHIGELLLFCIVLLAFERSTRAGSSRYWPVAAGLGLAAGPWVWQGSTLTLGVLGIFTAVAWATRVAGDGPARSAPATLASAGAVGGMSLSLTMIAWGPPGAFAAGGLNGLSAFQPASLFAAAAFGGILVGWDRVRPAPGIASRLARVVAAAVLPLAVLLTTFPGPVAQGMRALVGFDPWLASIPEYRGVLFGGEYPAATEFRNLVWGIGPVLLAPLVGIPAFRRRWAEAPGSRVGLCLLAGCAVIFGALLFRAVRFKLYAAPFLTLWAGLVLVDAFRRAMAATGGRRVRGLAGAGLMAVAAAFPAWASFPPSLPTSVPEDLIELLRGLREHAAPAPDRAVMAPWTHGHAIQYYANLPVVVTPFGTDLGEEPMRDRAAFLHARDQASAEAILSRRRVGYVLLDNPYRESVDLLPFAPSGTPSLFRLRRDWISGPRLEPLGDVEANVAGRLSEMDGTSRPDRGEGALDAFRLLAETRNGREKLFERVEGARLRWTGAAPGELVRAVVTVVSNKNRRFTWSTSARSDASGEGTLRLPYATGKNGAVQASAYALQVGDSSWDLSVPERAVRRGDRLDVSVAAGQQEKRDPR